jgi:hypothetical protein
MDARYVISRFAKPNCLTNVMSGGTSDVRAGYPMLFHLSEALCHNFPRSDSYSTCQNLCLWPATMQVFCQRHAIRPYRATCRYLRGELEQQPVARTELAALKTRAAEECVVLSPEEARFPLGPTWYTTVEGKGTPSVGGDVE